MIVYFDTSSLIPLLVEEPGSAIATRLWDEADRVVSVRLLYVEARAALALARRLGRVEDAQLQDLVEQFGGLWAQIDVIEIDEPLVRRAGDLAQQHGLRGYDAVHLAGAELVADEEMVMASGDDALCAAAQAMGVSTSNTSAARDAPRDDNTTHEDGADAQ